MMSLSRRACVFAVVLLTVGEVHAVETKSFDGVAQGAVALAHHVRLASQLLSPCLCRNEFQTRDCKTQQEAAAVEMKTIRQVFTDRASVVLGTYDFKKKAFPAQIKVLETSAEVDVCSGGEALVRAEELRTRRVTVVATSPAAFTLPVADESFARYLRENGNQFRIDVILAVGKTSRGDVRDEALAAKVKQSIELTQKLLKSAGLRADVRAAFQNQIQRLKKTDLMMHQFRAHTNVVAHRFWLSKDNGLEEDEYEYAPDDEEVAEVVEDNSSWFDQHVHSSPESAKETFSRYTLAEQVRMDARCRTPAEEYDPVPLRNCSALAKLHGGRDNAAGRKKHREYLTLSCEMHQDNQSCDELRALPADETEAEETDDSASEKTNAGKGAFSELPSEE